MAIPTILAGAAGRALRTLAPIAEYGVQGGRVASHQSRMVASNAATQLADATTWMSAHARDVINSAKGDVASALGTTRQPAFSSELHAASMNLRSSLEAIGSGNGYLAFANGAPARAGGASAQIATAMQELERAAATTARTRVIVGSLALGGAVAGAVALTRGGGGGGGSVPMAPGPIGEPVEPHGELV